MKITGLKLSVFELPAITRRFRLERTGGGWKPAYEPRGTEQVHVLHVATDEGLEGVCTVGDARYTRMDPDRLEDLRLLTIGEDPLQREALFAKLAGAARLLFVPPGWFGAFDNCLWDIAGKAAGKPVAALLGGAREAADTYYNFFGANIEACLDDAASAVEQGFTALKDHFTDLGGKGDIAGFEATRARFPEAVLMHDAALAAYSHAEALRVGKALEQLNYLWFEEPIDDRDLSGLRELCTALGIPILAGETLMHEPGLLAEFFALGAFDLIRGNARHGTTPLVGLARLAQARGATIELNGPGGLYGLVHAHLCCGIEATSYYEFFPGGTRDEMGKEIGLTNPPLPRRGMIRPPAGPGWGAEWDTAFFEKKRIAVL